MTKQKLSDLWNQCLSYIRDNISAGEYETWFSQIVVLGFKDGNLTLGVPSAYFIEQLDNKYVRIINSALHRYFDDAGFRQLLYSYKLANTDIRTQQPHDSQLGSYAKQSQRPGNPFARPALEDIDPQLNPKYTFENYCGSNSNKLAVSIGKAIAANDSNSKVFNPLFLFGPTGVGKTHLIQAIGIKIKEANPRTRVLYVSARVFESQYTTAVRNNKVNDFINFYQSIDVLILDDVQEFASKYATQNTFYHIFNELHQNQKHLILSSDRRPSEMDGMIDRLISRFKWGITVELSKPDYDLRRNVLAQKASQDGLVIPSDVLDFIANNVTDSVRELEGIVVSLLAHATMLNQDLNVDLAKLVIANAIKVSKKPITFELIAETVAKHYNIETDLLYGKSRKREISDARQLVMYFAKKETQLSSTNIGVRLSRNHATVLHACKVIEQRLTVEKEFKGEVCEIENALKK
ncbi:MAG: chromosomal replication initiator protein DnaA [Sodaliphilus sp.]|jgi:chromosomal replication initiator protein|nr:chromosomal replication initiator protein DnaA [Sodaliphilus sp.]